MTDAEVIYSLARAVARLEQTVNYLENENRALRAQLPEPEATE